jgi:hypothetical protein
MRYEVRCCCNPDKLLGWLDGPDNVRAFMVGGYAVAVRNLGCFDLVDVEGSESADGSVLVERVPIVKRAIPSDERPLEFWRALPGFEEA